MRHPVVAGARQHCIRSVRRRKRFTVDADSGRSRTRVLGLAAECHSGQLDGRYNNRTGANVYAYIIDTGIRTTHGQFGTRARNVYDAGDSGALTSAGVHWPCSTRSTRSTLRRIRKIAAATSTIIRQKAEVRTN
jgi:hypothetical protein